MATSVIQRSLAGGELSPAHAARADLSKWLTGLRTCKNLFVRKEGGISNRAGLRYVQTVKDSEEAMLLRFVHAEPGQSVLIEMGDGYFRFFLNGAAVEVAPDAYDNGTDYVPGDLVEEGGVNYYAHTATTGNAPPDTDFWYAMPADGTLEIPHHFEDHQPNWTQEGSRITLTHIEKAPAELVYSSLTRWVLRLITTAPWSGPPQNPAGVEGAAGTRVFRYVVTAARRDTYEETLPSAVIELTTAAEPTLEAPHDLTWDALDGAAEYYLYGDPFENGVFGFLGTAATNAFHDTGLVPDFTVTPPMAVDLFVEDSAPVYPDVSGMFQQRRVFARWASGGDRVDLSRTGFPDNFNIASPLQDDDALRFALAGALNHPVQWIVGLAEMLIGTNGGIWVVRGPNDGPLVPGAIDARQHVYHGVHDVPPVILGHEVIYVQARGRIVRDLRYSEAVRGQETRDLTIFATHLFEPSTLIRLAYAETPHSIVWAIRNDGVLLGLTYIPEQEIWGWHRHDTQGGAFEDVCVVPEAGEDIAYFIVRRTIDGETVRYIERMESRVIRTGAGEFNIDAFFVDAGLSYAGDGANSFSGLEHLEGEVVAVLADGEVIFNGDPDDADASIFTVTEGVLNLPGDTLYEDVHIGLPIRYADAETLDLDVQGLDVRDKKKRVGSVTLIVDRTSRGFQVGPDADHLRTAEIPVWDAAADAVEFTGQVEINLTADYNNYGRLLIRQPNPLPLTILGIIPHVALGG